MSGTAAAFNLVYILLSKEVSVGNCRSYEKFSGGGMRWGACVEKNRIAESLLVAGGRS